MTKSYIYADAQILAQREHTNPGDPDVYDEYFYVHDRLGSVRMVVKYNTGTNAVNTVHSYGYTPFGQFYAADTYETSAEADNPWAFTGQYYDDEIDQYYLRARQYDPSLMRFTSRDPEKGEFPEPLSLHRYLYCFNSPIDFYDPSGRSLEGQIEAIKEGSDIHNEAAIITTYGIASGNEKFLSLGILMQQMVAPSMDVVRALHARIVRLEELERGLRALTSIANKSKRQGGINVEDVQTMIEWANEYDVYYRGPEQHLDGNYKEWHLHIGNQGHITIRGYKP